MRALIAQGSELSRVVIGAAIEAHKDKRSDLLE
jgi:hypothetical protein